MTQLTQFLLVGESSDDRPMPEETVATRVIDRAEVKGCATPRIRSKFRSLVMTDTVPVSNERHLETVESLPGLCDSEAAWRPGGVALPREVGE